MTTRSFTTARVVTLPGVAPQSLRTTDYSLVSQNSSKVNNKLVLKPNTLTHREDRVKKFVITEGLSGSTPIGLMPLASSIARDSKLPPSFNWASTDNRAKARFDGKLRYGSASLGVTIASWKQSQEMIVKRLETARKSLDRTYLRLSNDRRLLRRIKREREPLAGQILELEFGWRPLAEDVKAALTTVIQHGVPDQSLRGVGSGHWQQVQTSSQERIEWDGLSRTCYQANVKITNPHLWMANRMGLLNIPGIALDLVPWSFVVNMFGNFNQLISGLTSYVGVGFENVNITRTVKMLTFHRFTYPNMTKPPVTETALLFKERTRTVGLPPPVSLELRVPEINWELCLIASSLVVQRIDRINKLIRVL